MDDFIKKGYIDFKTLAPVYIGCGRTVSKKEYLFNQGMGSGSYAGGRGYMSVRSNADKSTIEILQMDKVLRRINALGLADEFEKYLLANDEDTRREVGFDLYGFVRNHGIRYNEYSTWSDEIVEVADVSLNYHSIKDINLFVRNERGLPYVPGSSFKGMIRTALEEAYYIRFRDKADDMSERIKQELKAAERDKVETGRYPRKEKLLARSDSDIDVETMHRNLFEPDRNEDLARSLKTQKNDILRGLLVGDSAELSWDDMCICQKIDLNTDGVQRPFNVLREAVKPGVTIRIPISIDTRVCKYSLLNILGAIKVCNDNYRRAFAGKFPDAPDVRGNSTTFFLGGGTGYVSKTVTYGILREKEAVGAVAKIFDMTLNDRARREHKHYRDVDKNVSPHILKCTRYKGKLMQMGACCAVGYSRQ